MMSGRTVVVVTTLAILCIIATPSVARPDDPDGRGEDGSAGLGAPWVPDKVAHLFEPYVLRRDLTLIHDEFDLDKDQAVIVEMALLDYQLEFAEACEATREKFSELRPAVPGQAERRARRRDLAGQLRAIRAEIRALRQQTRDGEAVDSRVMRSLRQRLEELRVEIDAVRPPPMGSAERRRLEQRFSALAGEWGRTNDALAATFLAELRLLLSDAQAEAWPAFERALRRSRTLNRGELAGESVDLIVVVDALGGEEEERRSLEELVHAYAVELDGALRARNEYLARERQSFADATTVRDVDRAVSLLEPELKLRVAVRAVNDRYADAIAERLENDWPESAARFVRAYHRRADPSIYRRTRVQQAFRAAKEIEALADESRSAILALEAEYNAEKDLTNTRLVQVTREYETLRKIQGLRRRLARANGEETPRPQDPIRRAFEARVKMDEIYRQRLEALLTPQEIARLPLSRARMLERFDTDRDGKLGEEERQAAREVLRAERGGDGG